MLILNKPLDNAEEGVDYAPVWDPEEQGEEAEEVKKDDEFILAGYGTWSNWNIWKNGFYDNDLRSGPKFHKGLNLVESVQSNFYYYRMTNFRDGDLKPLKYEVA